MQEQSKEPWKNHVFLRGYSLTTINTIDKTKKVYFEKKRVRLGCLDSMDRLYATQKLDLGTIFHQEILAGASTGYSPKGNHLWS